MKTLKTSLPFSGRQSRTIYSENKFSGFTIIEMLVVIAIIAILAGIILPTLNKAYTRARISTVQKALVDFERAVDGYRTEYGRLPMPGGQGNDTVVATNDLVNIIKALQGDSTVTSIPNPKKMSFYESDLISSSKAFKDPWGRWIQVYFDGNYDNEISLTGYGSGTFRRNVIALSFGPDGLNASASNKDDDILSVQIKD